MEKTEVILNSRRDFLQSCLSAGAVLAIPSYTFGKTGPAVRELNLNRGWNFAGSAVTLPHCVTPLSWQNWDPASWEKVWTYSRRFNIPPSFHGLRIFLHFEAVMTSAAPVLNGDALPRHAGGYLPFAYEITNLAKKKDNTLTVAVDSRWQSVPPEGSPKGPRSVDYLEPGGIWGSVRVRAVPDIYIKDVFAKPVQVLDPGRRVELKCTLDAVHLLPGAVRLDALLMDGKRTVSQASESVSIEKPGETDVLLNLTNLQNVTLWDVERPHLYEVLVTASLGSKLLHKYRARIGLRDARFELDGFFLNGKRVQLFGLNRHEIYPYAGRAMPPRVLRHDAEILRRDFHCNIVRCSHYPQSEAFLDACDELGLMVWEEPPGWQYLGDEAWKDLVVRDVGEMVRRDRNHPSIVIWGVRINESHNDPALYRRTKEVAKSLDGTRQTSGSMTPSSTRDWAQNWVQDVFAYDDYHAAPDGSVSLREPIPGVPFFFTEAVGQFNYPAHHGFNLIYRRAGDVNAQQQQAIFHAQAHDRAAANKRYCGLIAWCAFEYASLVNGYHAVKCPGVADVFRIPKLGASFYLAQVDPSVQPVIEPNFYWDFGSATPSGPGEHAAILSNCDRLELHIDNKPHATLHADRGNFPHVKYPPFFAYLSLDGSHLPELRIDGYVGNRIVLSRSFSSDKTKDQLVLHADDSELVADGSDATRLVFRVADKFSAPRAFADGEVHLDIKGPGVIVGDNPFRLADNGGAGAVWIRTVPGRTGRVRVTASHPVLGQKSVEILVQRDIAEGQEA